MSYILFIALCTEEKSDKQKLTDKEKTRADIESMFTNAPGEEVYKANCITCHSLKYVDMQPSFPHKTWEKTVDKMIKNFGAPIPDSTAKVIVEYLMAERKK
nr:cytochrome c [Bacteroidota bacterium]